MSKTNEIIGMLESGIRAENLRQKVISNNVANLETPGYRRQAVKFEELLSKAMESPGKTGLDEIEAEVYQPNETPVKSNGNDVSWEGEVGEMVKNSLRHKAYVRILNKKYQQMQAAMDIKE
ncbi:MAG: flagellar basal body rod protein FlgB [Planctomycetota bacterium]|nr:flagellar basal body rod protein FlgB [Planctomycetota bacterium]